MILAFFLYVFYAFHSWWSPPQASGFSYAGRTWSQFPFSKSCISAFHWWDLSQNPAGKEAWKVEVLGFCPCDMESIHKEQKCSFSSERYTYITSSPCHSSNNMFFSTSLAISQSPSLLENVNILGVANCISGLTFSLSVHLVIRNSSRRHRCELKESRHRSRDRCHGSLGSCNLFVPVGPVQTWCLYISLPLKDRVLLSAHLYGSVFMMDCPDFMVTHYPMLRHVISTRVQ